VGIFLGTGQWLPDYVAQTYQHAGAVDFGGALSVGQFDAVGRLHGQSLQIVGHEQAFSAQLPPADEWLTLEFSNQRLPEEFTIRISDSGREWGDWSAVAIKMN
jgi:hypothetical protein